MNLTIQSKAAYFTSQQWSDGVRASNDQVIDIGTVVAYLGHVVGGMVRVRYDGQEVVIHPGATKELGR